MSPHAKFMAVNASNSEIIFGRYLLSHMPILKSKHLQSHKGYSEDFYTMTRPNQLYY